MVIMPCWSAIGFTHVIVEKDYWLSLSSQRFSGTVKSNSQGGGIEVSYNTVASGPYF